MAGTALRSALLIPALAWLPAPAEAEPTKPVQAAIEEAFLRFDPLYLGRRATRQDRLADLAAVLGEQEKAGHSLHCSQQIFLEAKHLIRYTALWDEIDAKLSRLAESLDDLDQDRADRQSPVDGHWGLCYERDFMRLGASVAGLQRAVDRDETPRYRLRVLPGLGSPKVLLDRLQTLLISDVARTGVDNRGELASLLISLSQSVYKEPLARMWNDTVDLTSAEMLGGMAEVFRFFLAGSQDPSTGYWGAWYLTEDSIVKTADLSFTYHIVAYTRGRVEHWPQILETTWRIERDEYPYGWSHDGRWNNHNLYDVARMLAYGWPYMDTAQQTRWRAKIAEMMDWSLRHTVVENLTFRYDPTTADSLLAEYYFGISFLDAIGYWRPSRRFWQQIPLTDPNSVALCRGLAYSLDTLGGGGWHRDAALQKLARNCGSD